jgi:hypothetical protein
MVEMTSKERFWKTVNFEEPDRVPIQLGGFYLLLYTCSFYFRKPFPCLQD